MTERSHDDFHELAAIYALDALDGAERSDFEAHLATCVTCRDEVAGFSDVAAEVAAAASTAPPPGLRERVLASAASTQQARPTAPAAAAPAAPAAIDPASPRRRLVQVAGLVAAAAILIAGIAFITVGGDNTDTDIVALLAAPDTEVLRLGGDGTGSLSVAWSEEESQLAVIGDGLDELDDSETYALWLLNDGPPIPAALFTSSDGEVRVLDDLDGDPAGWGVTVEPAGGSPAPTTDIIFVAEA